jgi:archaellum component FlaC
MCRVEDEIGEMKSEMSEMKSEMSEMRSDIGEIKITVNALSEGLLTTSREVKELKGQR